MSNVSVIYRHAALTRRLVGRVCVCVHDNGSSVVMATESSRVGISLMLCTHASTRNKRWLQGSKREPTCWQIRCQLILITYKEFQVPF